MAKGTKGRAANRPRPWLRPRTRKDRKMMRFSSYTLFLRLGLVFLVSPLTCYTLSRIEWIRMYVCTSLSLFNSKGRTKSEGVYAARLLSTPSARDLNKSQLVFTFFVNSNLYRCSYSFSPDTIILLTLVYYICIYVFFFGFIFRMITVLRLFYVY